MATAAYLTARPRIAAAHLPALDQAYATYMAGLPASPAVTDGVRVGQQASAAMLALRADDGFANVVLYECSSTPPAVGEFLPDSGCPSAPTSPQPVDVKVGGILPFTVRNIDAFRTDGPAPLESAVYARDFAETRDYRPRRQHAALARARPTSPTSGRRTPTSIGTATCSRWPSRMS